ncbi:DNA primase DnaG [Haloarcula nitratireducens]|uniref:DNA primase DnaG n=1 Tax=Haloarcula nitratireducens TaxID=2487749 RepID=A0AAW4PAF0_9EURY|nr:DNA primase DnaG [Halomicroarcula nitratireducens]MBX0294788.1 DNA primase [Halomicroarcula nitratireducens]
MHDTAKYLIHADITAAGVVERSDVVGAVFGQTEGLLGEEMDLRDLQESKKVGRIDVEIRSESGQSFGQITVASGLDRVETAILAAALETIEQVGPCRAQIEVSDIEDVRSAKRREVVDRATELLAAFEADSVQTEDIVETVRQRARVDDITEHEGLPAGPRVADSDAIVVVEGRADVLQLLKYGVKNAVAVEGTDVPEAVANLTTGRTVTAFLDGDRGGDLILKELAQVGDVDYVAIAPRGRSVEELSRSEAMKALRDKVPYDVVADADSPAAAVEENETSADDAATVDSERGPVTDEDGGEPAAVAGADGGTAASETDATEVTATAGPTGDGDAAAEATATDEAEREHPTLSDHVDAVIRADSGTVRLLDDELRVLAEGDADEVVSLVGDCDETPRTVVVDADCSQRILDVAAQRGVGTVVATGDGEYVKQPTSVQVKTVS